MSKTQMIRRNTIQTIRDQKGKTPIVSLVAYTAPLAKRLDPHLDLILVGDSLGMVIYGMDTTVGVTLDMMIAHGAAVVRATQKSCIVVDLPFGTYQESKEQAFRSAARVMMETGATAIKLEGGEEMAETVAFLTQRGVPVQGHIGLTPQHVNTLGGFKAQARTTDAADRLVADGKAIADAGAFSIVVEAVPEDAAQRVTDAIPVPTIGIGATAVCDGQILVSDDMLGMFDEFTPRFVKRFGEIGTSVTEAVTAYAEAVQDRSFPGPEHTFSSRTK